VSGTRLEPRVASLGTRGSGIRRALLLSACCLLLQTSHLSGRQTTEPTLDSLLARARVDSNDAQAHYDLAMAYWDKKRWDDAEHALREALAIAPSYAEAYLALAALPNAKGEKYWKKRLKAEGIEPVRKILIESQGYYRHAFLLNPLVDLRVLGKYEADDAVHFTVQQGGNYVVAVFAPWWSSALEKGINEFRQGRYDTAFVRLQNVIADKRIGSDDQAPDPIIWYHGLAAAHLGNFDTAIRDFALLTGRAVAREKAEQSPGVDLPLHTNDYRYILATMLYMGGKFNEAIPTFKRTLEFDVSLYVSHVQLARIYTAARLWDDALRERQAAVDANADDSGLLVDLGATFLQAGRVADAEDPLRRAGEMNPRDARTPYLLGLTLSQLGQAEEARAAFERFLAIAPSSYGPQISDVRRQLTSTVTDTTGDASTHEIRQRPEAP
jgi:tetratricopeptide (TPR) repeat protein